MTTTKPALNLAAHSDLTSPYALSRRAQAGLEPAAELAVIVPHGKSSRVIVVDLAEEELLLLAEKALAAARVLRESRLS